MKIFKFDQLDSTSDEAKRLIKTGVPEDAVIVADAQTKGRGKPGASWFSPPGVGLYFSLITKLEKDPRDLVPLTKAVAEAVVSVIGNGAEIKLPNDVLVNGKKVCGILLERVVSGHLIIGIGLNVNNAPGSFPAELKDKATSLLIETGREFDREQLLQEIVRRVKITL